MLSTQKGTTPDTSSLPDELVVATISSFRNQLEQIRREELNRYTRKMAATEIRLAEEVSANMMRKILNVPWERLQCADHSVQEMQLKLLGEIFSLLN